MTVKPNAAESGSSPAAGTVVLWCVMAGAVVSGALLLEPPDRSGLGYLSPAGALRLLADLAIFYVLFLVPIFAWRRENPLRASVEAAGVVVLTAAAGLVMIDRLTGLGAPSLATLIGFIVLACAGATIWAEALKGRPAVYYGFAAVFALGIPLVAFFAGELFRIKTAWPAWLSPFTAWRAILDRGDWVPWLFFGGDLAVGVVWLLVSRRRTKP
jgi:hypothetical protein